MEYRKLIAIFAFIFTSLAACAQEGKLALADSTAEQLYNAGDWKQLIVFGNKAITDSLDSPFLRFKIGYAYMVTGNYKAAIEQLNLVLNQQPTNSTARLYAYYCNSYLNNDAAASYHVGYLDKETRRSVQLSPFGFIDAAVETGIKLPNNDQRDNGFFERFGLSNRLGWRLQLEQSVIFFKQNILRGGFIDHKTQIGHKDRQSEYFAEAKFALNKDISLLGSYHYVYTTYRSNISYSNLGLLGVKYTSRYVDLQGDMDFGQLIDKNLKQYNAKVDFYPLGNLNLYTASRASLLNLSGVNAFIYSQTIGFKVLNKTWLETSATFGNLDDYLDTDGLYIYNSIDPTKFKCGETAFFQLGTQTLLNLNYSYEKKTDVYHAKNYNQNSVTLGIIWKF